MNNKQEREWLRGYQELDRKVGFVREALERVIEARVARGDYQGALLALEVEGLIEKGMVEEELEMREIRMRIRGK